MNLWKSFGGVLEIELVSADPEAALSAVNAVGIPLFAVTRVSDLVFRFELLRSDYDRLTVLCRKRGDTLTILRKKGLYFTFRQLLRRKLLLLGIGILVLGSCILPTRVLFVRVEGNQLVPTNRILAAAEGSGIRFGASRRAVRSERVKNALLDAVPQLQWAGVNTSGCIAVVSVRERSTVTEEPDNSAVASIVAARDGYVLTSVVTRGTGLVRPGQAVTTGQVLISGYTDCGICIQATHAEGEILAQTRRDLEVVTPNAFLHRGDPGDVKHSYSLLLGKKRIFFWKDSGISDTGCGRMYKEYYLTLPGGFRLPVAICVDSYQHYDTEEAQIQQAEAAAALSDFARQYLKRQMIAGQILHESHTVSRSGDVFQLRGSYVCTEMIGKVKPEQIGDTNGKTDGENR